MQGRILGIDYGGKRIGLAVSDPSGIIARGLPTIANRGLPDVLDRIKRIVLEFGITEIVVGYPLTMKAKAGQAAQSTDRFMSALRKSLHLPTVAWDERLTSKLAERTIRELGKSPGKNKEKVDELAAVFILQSYLDRGNNRRSQPFSDPFI
ncbi:MAG: Holliday junction resolvase RuvX [bacterium]